ARQLLAKDRRLVILAVKVGVRERGVVPVGVLRLHDRRPLPRGGLARVQFGCADELGVSAAVGSGSESLYSGSEDELAERDHEKLELAGAQVLVGVLHAPGAPRAIPFRDPVILLDRASTRPRS